VDLQLFLFVLVFAPEPGWVYTQPLPVEML